MSVPMNGESTDRRNPLQILLGDVVDYAGLFPPASLTMEQAVANYGHYLRGDESWMLGRFIVPVSRLEEFEEEFRRPDGDPRWMLSVLAIDHDDLRMIERFNRRAEGAVIDSVELKAHSVRLVEAASVFQRSYDTYIEISPGADLREMLRAIAAIGARAKIRTGGVTPEAFPTANSVASFVDMCRGEGVEFKATAGLHHPLRCVNSLTYEPDAPRGTMHGFMNFLITVALAIQRLEVEQLVAVLEENDPSHFKLSHDAISWRDHSLGRSEISAGRRLARSFGSCSFEEPIHDLRALGWM